MKGFIEIMPRRYIKRLHTNRCSAWNHPDRPQIDLALASGLAKRIVGQ